MFVIWACFPLIVSRVRYVDQARAECVSGDSDSISERPGRAEPAELQTDDEHLV